MCTDRLDDTVDKYKKPYHKTIKMKLVNVKLCTYVEFDG